MIAIIIAGGSGTRLWPLSTPDYPKHLLKLTNEKSLLQNTYERACLVADKVYVISEASHVEFIYEQLSELPREQVIVEPARRGTASCFIRALAYIKDSCDPHEPIVFMHADHQVNDTENFQETVERASGIAIEHHKIVLLGIQPTYAATGFGYIERGSSLDDKLEIYNVKSFKEKPDKTTAEKYITQGNYLWNMGFFVASLAIFEKEIEEFAPKLWENYQKLLITKSSEDATKVYLSFETEQIDIALIEQVKDLLVTSGSFDWMDVGSFKDVHRVNTQDEAGNTLTGLVQVESVANSLVRNDTETPVAVIGLENVAVISTSEGILVTNKDHVQKVGDVSKRFKKK